MSVINTNYLALVSQNNLTKSQNSLGTAIERLSSGLRINSAKDDAAGQAIANRFTANINGLTQAARNANDGISVAQTTEGALNEINENLQRIRTLTVQATTGSNSDTDLASIQAEIGERLNEINRVSEQTQFNGVKVLAKDDTLTVQVGAHDGEKIDINLKQIDSSTLKLGTFSVRSTVLDTEIDQAHGLKDKQSPAVDVDDADIKIQKGGKDVDDLDASDIKADAKGNLYIKVDNEWHHATAKVTDGKPAVGNVGDTGYVPAEKPTAVVSIGAKATNIVTDEADVVTKTTDPLAALDNALQQVDSLRSELGAVQNRFQSTIANLNNTVNNLSAARSRIEDADYAVEVSNMTRAQILQQAGTSVLAQANQVPQTVLSLLR
ncbi:FliC/FljB family flagellin [Paenalcaligenes sp. Me131]|uniref:FliC/FljB family flagellin n=1 Tax=Paenalcaligenes sp. Me131 TaxID=3392636 RepID=UPI003D2A0522